MRVAAMTTRYAMTTHSADPPIGAPNVPAIDGKAMFTIEPSSVAGRKMMAVSVAEVSGTLRLGQAAPLFDLPIGTTGGLNIEYDVVRDRRFLFNIPVENQAPKAIVTLNWKAGLKKWARRIATTVGRRTLP